MERFLVKLSWLLCWLREANKRLWSRHNLPATNGLQVWWQGRNLKYQTLLAH